MPEMTIVAYSSPSAPETHILLYAVFSFPLFISDGSGQKKDAEILPKTPDREMRHGIHIFPLQRNLICDPLKGHLLHLSRPTHKFYHVYLPSSLDLWASPPHLV